MPLLDNHIPVEGSDYRGGSRGVLAAFPGGNRSDMGLKRPFFDAQDRPCVIANTGRWTTDKGERVPLKEKHYISDLVARGMWDPVWNATSLRKEDWIELDRVVLMSARQRLRAWSDLAAANSFGGFNGFARMTLEFEAMSDPGSAVIDFDALTDARTDTPLFKLRSLPLPITHSDFWFSSRKLAVSGNSTPLDMTMAEAAARRVAESVEDQTTGVATGPSYGYTSAGRTAHDVTSPDDGHGSALDGSKVYGYTTYPHRHTLTTMTAPTGTNPNSTLANVLTMRNTLYANRFYGPFTLYHSTDWDAYLDNDYYVTSTGAPYQTLRDRLRAIDGISDVRRIDRLTSTFTMILVQMTQDVARAVIGMPIQTVQWESQGGMRQNFKCWTIMVPQLRSDYAGRCGILHGSTS